MASSGAHANPRLRMDLRGGTKANLAAEFGLLALCFAAGLTGLHFKDVRVTIGIFVGGLGIWMALSLPGWFNNVRTAKEQEIMAKQAATKAAAVKPALPPPAAVLALIKARRSIFAKDYGGARVPRASVEMLLEAANWAPNHNLSQPWRFVVLEGEGKAKFEALTIELVGKYTVPSDKAPEAVERMKGKAAKTWPLVSHYIVICMKRVPGKSGKSNPEWEDLAAVSCSVQNMALLAASMDLGAYWSSWNAVARDAPEMSSFLGLDPSAGDKCLGVFCLGTNTERASGYRGSRTPYADKVTWIS